MNVEKEAVFADSTRQVERYVSTVQKERAARPGCSLALVLVEDDLVDQEVREAFPHLIEEGFQLAFPFLLPQFLAENAVGIEFLPLLMNACVRHRVNKPSLSFYLWWSGWRLATS